MSLIARGLNKFRVQGRESGIVQIDESDALAPKYGALIAWCKGNSSAEE